MLRCACPFSLCCAFRTYVCAVLCLTTTFRRSALCRKPSACAAAARAQSSQVDLESPDLATFPQFASCRALEAILLPGDVLYLPPLWMHHVTALSPSISISVWTSHADYVCVRTGGLQCRWNGVC